MTDQNRDLILGGKFEIICFWWWHHQNSCGDQNNGGCFSGIKRKEHESDSSLLATVKVITLFHVEAVRHKSDLHNNFIEILPARWNVYAVSQLKKPRKFPLKIQINSIEEFLFRFPLIKLQYRSVSCERASYGTRNEPHSHQNFYKMCIIVCHKLISLSMAKINLALIHVFYTNNLLL
jgi:hypothetical protein